MEIQNLTTMPFAMMHGRLGFPAHSLSLIVRGTFKLVEGAPAELLEDQPPIVGDIHDEEERLRYEGEFVPFKPKADLLLAGHCHTPGEEPLQSCPVLFRVGQVERLLGIFGDRHWQKKVLGLVPVRSDPEPFTSMPLTYDRAFGGNGYAANPIGMGASPSELENGETVHRLPNIEDPHDLITATGSKPQPAGYGPVPKEWALRSGKLGTYRKDYLQTRWPWFPEDFDPSYWNAAPPEMQVEFLKGDETVFLQNLVAGKPEYSTQLPGLRVRCFVHRTPTPENEIEGTEEVPMVLDTLHVDADAMTMCLVWRGHTAVTDEEHAEISHVLIGSEPADQPPVEPDYEAAAKTQAVAEEAPFAPETAPEMPVNMPEPPEASGLSEAQLEELKGQVEAQFKEAGGGLDGFGKESAPLGEQVAAMRESGIDDGTIEELRQLLAGHDSAAVQAETPAQAMTPAAAVEQLVALAAAGASLAGVDLAGASMAEVEFPGADLMGARLQEIDLGGAKLPEAVLKGAQASQASLAGADLAGADLSGADLSAADLSGANLSGACLDDADLTGANLAGANLSGASAVGATMPEVVLDDADLSGADLSSADLSHSSCQRTNFTSAIMVAASIENTHAPSACFTGVDGANLRASGSKCPGADVKGARLASSQWKGAELQEAEFDNCVMTRVNLEKINAEGSSWSAADLREARFYKASVRSADFSKGNLMGASLERAIASNATFDLANLYGVDFHATVLDGVLGGGIDPAGIGVRQGGL